MRFPVYKIYSKMHYGGSALVAANSAKEANEFIDSYKEIDKDNSGNSWGYSYVDEDDRLSYIFATCTGILDYGIYYTG